MNTETTAAVERLQKYESWAEGGDFDWHMELGRDLRTVLAALKETDASARALCASLKLRTEQEAKEFSLYQLKHGVTCWVPRPEQEAEWKAIAAELARQEGKTL